MHRSSFLLVALAGCFATQPTPQPVDPATFDQQVAGWNAQAAAKQQAAVVKPVTVDVSAYRIAAANPATSKQPLVQGWEKSTRDDCAPFVGQGTRVEIRGKQLCLAERYIFKTRPTEPRPHATTNIRTLHTDAGATERFLMKTSEPAQIARCVGKQGEYLVWAEEAKYCVEAPNLLTRTSTFLAVHVFDPLQATDAASEGQENVGWTFAARTAQP